MILLPKLFTHTLAPPNRWPTFFRSLGKSVTIPLIFTSSETLYPHQRTKIEQTFGGKVADWYGNAERNVALQQSTDGWYDELPLYSVNEFYDQYVVGTSLINFSSAADSLPGG